MTDYSLLLGNLLASKIDLNGETTALNKMMIRASAGSKSAMLQCKLLYNKIVNDPNSVQSICCSASPGKDWPETTTCPRCGDNTYFEINEDIFNPNDQKNMLRIDIQRFKDE